MKKELNLLQAFHHNIESFIFVYSLYIFDNSDK